MQKKGHQKWISLFVMVLLVLGLSRLGGGAVQSVFYAVSRPIHRFFDYLGQRGSGFLGYFQNKKIIEAERDALFLEKQNLLKELAQKDDCLTERDALAEKMQVARRDQEWQEIMGRLTYANPAQDWALINLGGRNGIETGQPVITSRHVLIGKVSEVYHRYSRVMLLSHPDSLVKVKTVNQPSAVGFLQGRGGGVIGLEAIDVEQPFRLADNLITEPFRNEYPGGLLAGQIRHLEKDDVRAFLEARVAPFYQVSSLDVIFAVKDF